MSSARALLAGALAAVGLALVVAAPGPPERREGATVAHAAVLQPWYTALAEADRAPATVVVMGDSVSEGYGLGEDLSVRWVSRLQDALRGQGATSDCPTGPSGFHGTTSLVPAWYAAPTLPDARTTGQVREIGTVGPGGRALVLGPGATVSWRVSASEVAVGYRTGPAGGDLEITADGQETLAGRRVVTQDPVDERRVWHSQSQDLDERTWTVRNLSPDRTVTVTDLTPFRGDRDRCVHVVDASHSGISARSVSERVEYIRDSLSMNPDLLVVPLGFNDARAGQTPDELRESLRTIVATSRRMGYEGPVLLVSWHAPPPAFFDRSWSGYREALRSMSEEDGVAYVDAGAAMPPVVGAPRGVYLDALHPGRVGQVIIAETLTRVLTPPGPVLPVPSTTR
ncbi:GDSL-type esterase/lipase family protein [Janibacter sp. Y6]|uniref:SGNH/GDSL hydrolase family protein n=1 Tax=Janibacter sp. Y6 TaxID=2913552 RepID=UPI0034A58B8B